MADKDDDGVTVNVDDLDSVKVTLTDEEAGLVDPKTEKVDPKVAKPKTPRVNPEPDHQTAVTATGPTPEQALQEAQAFAKTQEEARRAAEATAANERTLREQAQRQAAASQLEVDQQRERADNSELANIENGIAAANREIEAREAEYTRAAEAGEFVKMASIQTKLSKAAAALDRLETQKVNFEASAKTDTAEGRVEAPAPGQPNAVERYLSQMAPNAQNWLRQHPDCMPANIGGNPAKNSLMMAGHYAALAKNIQEGSPEYFKTIEAHINPQTEVSPAVTATSSKAADVTPATTETKPKHVATPSAPVTRDSSPGSSVSRNVREVRLTKDQQEMAKVSFPHLPEAQAYGQYARNLIELEAEGKIGRLTH